MRISPRDWRRRLHDKDRLGGDYRGFDVKIDHIEDCEDACKSDAKCAAWTYVKPVSRNRRPGAISRALFPRCLTMYTAYPALKFGSDPKKI